MIFYRTTSDFYLHFCTANINKMNKIQELLKTLVNYVKCQDELINYKVNKSIGESLSRCFYYSTNSDDQNLDLKKVIEIESILDFLHDELNTGHWSNVPLQTRRCFTSASYIKCLITIKCSEQYSINLLQKCLKCLDLGLILGAPLENNHELLIQSAKFLTDEINKASDTANKRVFPKFTCTKRKLGGNVILSFVKLKGMEILCTVHPSLEHFNKNYFLPQVPVKLKGCMDYWPATKKWVDVNYFLNIAGDRTVPIEVGPHYVDENWSQQLMTLKEFIKNHYLEKNDNIGYLAQYNLFEQIPELKEDICIPDYCCLSVDYENTSDPDINAWFGPKGTVSPLHYDPKNNILAQVYGTKQIILFSPQDSTHLYPHEENLLFNTAQVNPVEPDFEKHPNFSKATMYKCLLEHGEMLFIPSKWWHHVTALDKSFSVSFWWQ